MNIKITSDSTCDLPPELIEEFDIGIMPLYVLKDGKMYKDGIDIHPKDIYEYVDGGKGICQTSAVNTGEYLEYFTGLSAKYDAVIHINISSFFSACHQNAVIAAAELKNVYIVDSLNLSTGTGHLVLDAALMARAGMAPEEIVDTLNANAPDLDVSFIIDALKYLYKGGRCSAVAALGSNVLKLKPCIEVVDGKMQVGKKYRGNFDKVIIQYVIDKLKDRTDVDYRRIFITYTEMVPEEVVRSVRETVASLGPWQEILQSTAGCTISNHCGTVCLGILFFRKHTD